MKDKKYCSMQLLLLQFHGDILNTTAKVWMDFLTIFTHRIASPKASAESFSFIALLIAFLVFPPEFNLDLDLDFLFFFLVTWVGSDLFAVVVVDDSPPRSRFASNDEADNGNVNGDDFVVAVMALVTPL